MSGRDGERRARLPGLLAWLAALALVAALLWRVSWSEFRAAWGEHAGAGFVLWVLALSALPLPLDAWATRGAFARLGLDGGWRELLLARGASYLLGLLHFAAGQGGLLLWLVRRGTALHRASVALLFVAATQALGLLAAGRKRRAPAACRRDWRGRWAGRSRSLALGGAV